MKITGLVHKIGQTEEIGNNGFTKRQLVVETQEQYKQTIPIDFIKDKTSLLDGLVLGQSVEVSINVRGNEYNEKYYVNLQGWKIESLGGGGSQSVQDPTGQGSGAKADDDLPF